MAFDPADANDFRVLTQIQPARLAELCEKDPAALVIGLLQSHMGRIDSDHLEQALCPRVIPAEKWAAWWSKAKTALRRHPNVIVEGRNPIIMTYHAAGQTLEEEIEPQWLKAESPAQRLAVVESYFREAKARKLQPQPAMVRRMVDTLRQRVDAARKGSPADALNEALILDRIAECAPLPDGVKPVAADIIAETRDLVLLFSRIHEHRLYGHALELVHETMPDKWQDLFLQLLNHAPTEVCDAITQPLHEAGRTDDVRRVVEDLLANLDSHLDAVCWLWEGPSVTQLEPVPRRELLPRLLEHLNALSQGDMTPPNVLRNARARIRAALSHNNYKHYREIITSMEPGMASTVSGPSTVLKGSARSSTRPCSGSSARSTRSSSPRPEPIPGSTTASSSAPPRECRNRNPNSTTCGTSRSPKMPRRSARPASHGDLSENSEFKFALEERDLLQARVLRMQQELSLARIVSANDVTTNEIGIGTRVTLNPTARGRIARLHHPWALGG